MIERLNTHEPLTDAQWGAALRWLLCLSLEPIKTKVKHLGGDSYRVKTRMELTANEPTWWHRAKIVLDEPPQIRR